MKTITLAAINIVLPPPHRPERYRDLWLAAFEIHVPVRLRGDTGGVIGSAYPDEARRLQFIWGDLYKFVNIELSGSWLDIRTGRRASREEIDRQVRIPENLRPNLRVVPYAFYPKLHRLVFASWVDIRNSMSQGMAQRLLETTLGHGALIERFGRAEVTIEPEHETLRRIFAMPRIKQLHIEVSPPNALGDVERKLFRLMNQRNADKYTQEFVSHHPDGLQVDNEMKNVSQIAQSNGYVSAKVENNEGKVESVSTADHPLAEKITYDDKVMLPRDALMSEGEGIARAVAARDQPNDP